MSKTSQMTCCLCGCNAGRWKQHHNRDTEYGICTKCVTEEAGRLPPERLEDLYGKPGVNYEMPTVRYMGRRFRLQAVFPDTDAGARDANAFMARTPGASVPLVSDAVYIVHEDDLGEPIEASSTTPDPVQA